LLETFYDDLSVILFTSSEDLPAYREREAEGMRQVKKIVAEVERKMRGKEVDREVEEVVRYMREVVMGEVEERVVPLRDRLV
jgi:predicted Holliday junction resolvase-like endonuclease